MDKRIVYIDVMRVITMIMVILLHVVSGYVVNADFQTIGGKFLIVVASSVRFVVPVFIMISGASILNSKKEYNIKDIWGRKILKMVIILIVWTSIYALFYWGSKLLSGVNMPLLQTIQLAIRGIPCYHLYYIYILIGLYMITPVLKPFLENINKKELQYVLILSFMVTIFIPFISNIFNIGWLQEFIAKFAIDIIGGYTFYYLFGYYLSKYEVKNYLYYILGTIGLILNIIFTYIITKNQGTYSEAMLGRLTPTVALYSLAIFLLIKQISEKFLHKEYKIVHILRKNSLGIYLIHVIVILGLEKLNIIQYNNNVFVFPLIYTLIVLAISFVISYIISKIKYIKTIV